jgi:hypothetical protein
MGENDKPKVVTGWRQDSVEGAIIRPLREGVEGARVLVRKGLQGEPVGSMQIPAEFQSFTAEPAPAANYAPEPPPTATPSYGGSDD